MTRARSWGNGAGRFGKAARAIAKEVGSSNPETLLLAEMLKDSADLADSCRNQQDRPGYISATTRMLMLLKAIKGGAIDGLADDDAASDGGAGRVAELLGAGPEVGDSQAS
jgi:hypothetical protein